LLLLASASPRRRELLERLGVPMRIVATQADEQLPDLPLQEAVVMLARRKGEAAMARREWGEILIAADTLVLCQGEVMGKPDTPGEARRMLERLADRQHEVVTGVWMTDGDRDAAICETTQVTFGGFDQAWMPALIADGMDKAGAYGIQSVAGLFCRGIVGSFENVMGLPLCLVREQLTHWGMMTGRQNGRF